jgi:hypothetical protein
MRGWYLDRRRPRISSEDGSIFEAAAMLPELAFIALGFVSIRRETVTGL